MQKKFFKLIAAPKIKFGKKNGLRFSLNNGLSRRNIISKPMKKRCPKCQMVNFSHSKECVRCRSCLIEVSTFEDGAKKSGSKSMILQRAIICVAVIFLTLLGFYLSLLYTSKSLSYDEKQIVQKAITVLDEKGFSREVFLLNHLTSFRGNDNWLNASTKFENAYAATNFPIEIMTIYPEFFTDTLDDTERAAILLHEAQHLKGADEKEAYQFVWQNRKILGWTKETYDRSVVWTNVRVQTKEFAPNLFVCNWNETGDCTE